jgi:hypothetical protein
MSIAAALCSYLIVTREARLGLNGPQVIAAKTADGAGNDADNRGITTQVDNRRMDVGNRRQSLPRLSASLPAPSAVLAACLSLPRSAAT